MAGSADLERRPTGVGPVTPVGLGILALGVVSYVAGWRLGWIELMVVAAGCLGALVLAVPFIVGRSRLRVDRSFEPERIEVGETVEVRLHISNPGRGRSRRARIEEHIGDSTRTVAVPGLPAGDSESERYTVTPPIRGRLALGPAVISRADPLGLLRRSVAHSTRDHCWVYPATTLLAAPPAGFAKDLEGPTSDASPAGDVAFHAVRPYVIGDDRRHIHWLSTARIGSLMVRHYVDNRRPHLGVLLDTDPDGYDEEHFEHAVSAAASVASSMLVHHLPASARIGRETVLGRAHPNDRDGVMEAFTECSTAPMTADDLTLSVAGFLRQEPAISALVIVTGARPATEMLGAVAYARRRARTIVASAAPIGQVPAAVPGARVLRASTLDDFAAGWAVMVS